MSDKTFQVVFRGKTVSDFSEEQVVVRLAALFKREPSAMRSLFDGERKILKKGLSRDKANQYREVLKKAGALVAVVAERGQIDQPEQPARRATFAVDEPVQAVAEPSPEVADEGGESASADSVNAQTSPNDGERTSAQPLEDMPAMAGALSLAPPGAILDHLQKPEIPPLDVSDLSLDDSGARFSEPDVVDPPEFDISDLVALEEFEQLDETAKPPPVNLDVDLDLDDSDDVLDATPPPPNLEIPVDHLESNDDFDHLDSSPQPAPPVINTDKLGLLE